VRWKNRFLEAEEMLVIVPIPEFRWKDLPMVTTDTTDEINLHAITCSECGEPMDEHGCPGAAGHAPVKTVTVTTRSTGPRKPAGYHPTCPACGGRAHFNMGATPINAECMWRQYCMSVGSISDPSSRLPVMTAEKFVNELAPWVKQRLDYAKSDGTTYEYGTIASSGGGYSTYSAKRRAEAAAQPKEEKPKRTRAKKSISEVADEVSATASTENGTAEVEAPAAVADPTEAEIKRAERRAARQAKLGALAGKR
jgi:hypothetical protein